MTEIEFKATLQMLVPMIIQIIIEKNNLSAVNSIKILYRSMLYEKLEKESTKLWHLSPLALYELFDMEQKTEKIIFPTEV